MSREWKGFRKANLMEWTSTREGEQKWGECISFFNEEKESFEAFLNKSDARYIIIGIKECSGPVANLGKEGAQNGFDAFLKTFVNIQNNRFLNVDTVALGGYLEFPFEKKSIDQHRDDVAIIDYHVFQATEALFNAGKIPIVIGGGHNNAYPIIKGFFNTKKKKINVLNIDPHADFRAMEGRHSGNSFSYAMDENMLSQYAVYGLHESFNSESMLEKMEETTGVSWMSFEKIVRHPHPQDLFLRYIERLQHQPVGLEIDMDALAYMPVSAFTPSGFTVEQIRAYISLAIGKLSIRYMHLPEGAPKNEEEEKIIGKTLTFLVTDFMKHLT